MLFLDLYGTPGAPASRLPKPLRLLAGKIADWKRTADDRRILARMTIRQLEDLQLSWPDDFRDIKSRS